MTEKFKKVARKLWKVTVITEIEKRSKRLSLIFENSSFIKFITKGKSPPTKVKSLPRSWPWSGFLEVPVKFLFLAEIEINIKTRLSFYQRSGVFYFVDELFKISVGFFKILVSFWDQGNFYIGIATFSLFGQAFLLFCGHIFFTSTQKPPFPSKINPFIRIALKIRQPFYQDIKALATDNTLKSTRSLKTPTSNSTYNY